MGTVVIPAPPAQDPVEAVDVLDDEDEEEDVDDEDEDDEDESEDDDPDAEDEAAGTVDELDDPRLSVR